MGTLVQQQDLAMGSTLVLAPHADDEIIGCGGWLILTREHGVKRVVVFCTQRDEVRRTEAEAAYQGLFLDQVIDLGLPEGGFAKSEALDMAVEKIRALIQVLSPAYIFTPTLSDPHPDHSSTNTLLHIVLSDLSAVPASTILQYEGFVPLGNANWWLDISAVIDEKQRRLQAYQSQEHRYGLVSIVNHLNAYRGRTLFRRAITHAEVYKQMSRKEYLSCAASLVF